MENDKELIEQNIPETDRIIEAKDEQNIFDDYVMKMTDEEKKDDVILEPNKPAFLSMRLAALLVDVILIFLVTFGLRELMDVTPISSSLQSNYYDMCYVADHLMLDDLGTSETYGVMIYEDDERYSDSVLKNLMVYPRDDESARHYKIIKADLIDGGHMVTTATAKAYENALSNNARYASAKFNCKLIDYGLVMLAAGVSELIFIFVIPITNKRRATIGKLIFGIQVIDSKYQVKARWYQLVGRYLFILAFETALPHLFLTVAIYTALIVPPVLALTTLTNKRRRSLNDLISRTESIDVRTFVPLDEQ